MFRSRRCQARVARALVARVGLERLWSDEGPTPEARLLREAEHLPLAARERALCRLAWLIWDDSSEITLGDLLDLTDGEDLATVAGLLRSMSLGADAVDAWLEGRKTRSSPTREPSVPGVQMVSPGRSNGTPATNPDEARAPGRR